MKLKTLFIAGIMAIAVAGGVIEALCSPRKKGRAEEKKGAEERQPL